MNITAKIGFESYDDLLRYSNKDEDSTKIKLSFDEYAIKAIKELNEYVKTYKNEFYLYDKSCGLWKSYDRTLYIDVISGMIKNTWEHIRKLCKDNNKTPYCSCYDKQFELDEEEEDDDKISKETAKEVLLKTGKAIPKNKIKDEKKDKDKKVSNKISMMKKKAFLVKNCKCEGKVINDFMNEIDSRTFKIELVNLTYVKLHGTDFIEKMDVMGEYLPIRNNKKVSLRTGKVEDRTHNDYCSFESPVSITKKTENAEKFFTSMFPDKEKRKYFQKSLGYMISEDTSQQIFFVWLGKGKNGKSTVLSILEKILGDYALTCDSSIFSSLKESGEQAKPTLFKMKGKRMASYSEGETSDKMEFNQSCIKRITGDDTITARTLYKEPIQFKCIAKMCYLANCEPPLTSDRALFRRTRLIPFEVLFSTDDKLKEGETRADNEFTKKIMNEYFDEVFTWILQGAMKYFKDDYNKTNFEQPEDYKRRLDEIYDNTDSFKSFMEIVVEKTENPKDRISQSGLYDLYESHCKSNKLRCITNSSIRQRMNDEGFGKVKNSIFYYTNIRIRKDYKKQQQDDSDEEETIDDVLSSKQSNIIKQKDDEIAKLKKEIEELKSQLSDKKIKKFFPPKE